MASAYPSRALFLFFCTPLSLVLTSCGLNNISGSSHASTPLNETLVWSDEFNEGGAASSPDPSNWAYHTGNGEDPQLEVYCSPETISAPCETDLPNAYVGADGNLHIVARRTAATAYTSAMLWTQGLQSFLYGRIEARMKLPSTAGFWPAFWMLGDNYSQVQWPKCGEIDVMETHAINAAQVFDAIHGTGFATQQNYLLPAENTVSSDFHAYGVIWSPQKLEFYVDDPSNVYSSFTPASLPAGAVWPFDSQKFFLILNMSVWSPASASEQEMLVDYVRVWKEQAPNDN
jgi:beta-glucanase (GH16 family)